MKPAYRVDYLGQPFYIQSNGRYYNTRKPINGERLLHRVVWSQQNGSIPDGYDVHHKNNKWWDNELGNLDLIDSSVHKSRHWHESQRDPAVRAARAASLKKAILKAVDWHKGAQGHAWHVKNGRHVMALRLADKVTRQCLECGGGFESCRTRPRKWCSDRCYNKYSGRQRRAKKRVCA